MGRQLRILVVDNEPRITEVLGEMLGEGREIRILNDAVEAARLLDTETFDVLVTDFVMPGLDGGRLSEIAWDRCGAHCIVLTGNDPGQVRRGGAVASVHRKPPKWRLLLDELRELERSLDG